MIMWYRILKVLAPHCTKEVTTIEECLKDLYCEQKLSLETIAALAGGEILAGDSIKRKLQKYGVPIKPRGAGYKRKTIPLTLEDFNWFTARELALKHNVHVTTIYERKHQLLKEVADEEVTNLNANVDTSPSNPKG